jgi:DNA invertase Pin-like site-specific DNA recombinase
MFMEVFMRCVTYKRISTQHQDIENQSNAINKQIELLDWSCVGQYAEVISGTKSRDTRPELRRLLADARKRKFDRVVVYELSRLGRSIVDVINTIHELEEVGVNLFVVKNGIDTSTSQGKIFANFINIFSELERDFLVSRQKESIKRIRKTGGKWGRGKLIPDEMRDRIVSLRTEGFSYRGISTECDVAVSSIQYVLKTHSMTSEAV